ncbi:MAG: hypothetical protein Fur003_2670 [Candidatus Dojkabacteria bacterium]
MKVKNLLKYASTQGLILVTSASSAMAQSQYLPQSLVQDGDLIQFVKRVLNLVITLAALVAAGYLIYSGVQYILAAGDEGKVEKATKGITYSVIGLVIGFIAVLVVNFVLNDVIGAKA